MSGFQIQVTTTGASESVTLPLVSGQTYNCTVDWGEGSPVSVTAWDDADATHVYATPGTYTVEITGQCDGWSVNDTHSSKLKWTSIVYWGDALDVEGLNYATGMFFGCSNITSLGTGKILAKAGLTNASRCFQDTSISSIPSGLLDNLSNATDISHMFRSTLISGIPSSLLDYCTSITSVQACWYGCSSLVGVPVGLFDNCTAITNTSFCWNLCVNLTNIPDGLFKNLYSLTDFSYCFASCNKLCLNPWMLYDDGQQSTRFLNKSVSFLNSFTRSSFSGNQGQAPDLWNCDFGTGTPTTTNCFAGAGNSLTSLVNYNNIPAAWGGTGYVDTPPEITAVDLTDVCNGSEIDVTGTDFEASGGDMYACDTDVLSDTTKVSQTIDTQSDTALGVTIVGLSGTGTKYLYFIDSDSQITDSPWSITYWDPPTLTGISTTVLKNGMVGVVLSGTDFMSSGASMYACPTDSYAEVNELSITGQTDTEITFGVSGLTPGQAYFLYVKTSLGQHNTSGTEVSVISSHVHDPRKRNFHPEFLRGALFGESFQSEIRTEYSGAAIIGTPAFSRFSGFTSDGTAQLSYSIDAAFPSHGSLVCAFKGTSDGLVVFTADLSGGTPSDGYCTWVDSNGYVHASISDGASIDTLLVDDANFLDGEWHVLTYTTDLTRSIHSLLIDQYYSTGVATVSGTIGSGKSLLIGDTGGFAGSIRGLKVFNESLSHREHMLYARVVEE